MNNKNILKSRKFRYGVYSTAFVAFFIAIMIAFNGIFSVLANRFGWYVDMTSESVFTFSEASKDYLKDIKSDVTIYFASDADKLVQDAEYLYKKRVNEASEKVAMFEAMYKEYALNEDITLARMYFEAISEILPGVKLYIVTTGDGEVQMLLPLEDLMGGN
jgi:hypothetical protein